VLKPGQYFALDEWCLTDRFDPNNGKHLAIKAEIELGDGLPDIRTTRQCVQAMKDAGFEVPHSYIILTNEMIYLVTHKYYIHENWNDFVLLFY
jgi:hypothetical protein